MYAIRSYYVDIVHIYVIESPNGTMLFLSFAAIIIVLVPKARVKIVFSTVIAIMATKIIFISICIVFSYSDMENCIFLKSAANNPNKINPPKGYINTGKVSGIPKIFPEIEPVPKTSRIKAKIIIAMSNPKI